MSDLIRRQDAIKAVESLPNCDNGFSDTYDKACFIGLLEEIPATNAVPIVPCKDCKWWKSIFSWNGNEHKVCVKEPTEPPRKAEFFCAYGERRSE